MTEDASVAPSVPPVLVLGVGNPLMRDEGVGPRIVEFLLDGFDFPETVEVLDAGTMGYMILDLLRGRERLLVLDAVKGTDLAPGTVLLLTPDEIAPNTVLHSMHDLRVADVLQAATLVDIHVDTMCIGVQIESIDQWITDLSEPVEAAIPTAAAAALDVLQGWGIRVTPRKDGSSAAQVIRTMRTFEPTEAPSDAPDNTT